MAETKQEAKPEQKAVVQTANQPEILRQMIIPLKKEVMKVANYKKTKKAIIATKQFLKHHLKAENVILGDDLNKEIHKNGRKNPPTKLKVKVYKFKDKLVADTLDAEFKKEEVVKKKGLGDKMKGLVKKDKPTVEQQEKKEVLEQQAPEAKKQEKVHEDIKKTPKQTSEAKRAGDVPRDEKPTNVKKK